METLFHLARHNIVLDSACDVATVTTRKRKAIHRRSWERPRETSHGALMRRRSDSHPGSGSGDCDAAPVSGQARYEPNSTPSAIFAPSADEVNMGWAEYTARKTVITFRSRKSASRPGSLKRTSNLPPSRLVQRVLRHEYVTCTQSDTKRADRFMAVFYCWFYGWITSVYSTLTNSGTERSFARWMLSCVLVMSASLLLIGLAAILTHLLIYSLAYVGQSALRFVVALVTVFICLVTILAIVSYD